MKCPKCQYLSFDSGQRCRNCGYDFSLAARREPDDLEIQTGSEPLGPLDDFALNDDEKLPLFLPEHDSDAPLVKAGAAPRAPLAVRRGPPTTGRPARPKRDPHPAADPEPRLALDTAEVPVVHPSASAGQPARPPATGPLAQAAGHAARAAAATIDLAILGALDLIVLYFTLKICDLSLDDARLLPAAPFLSFLLLLNGGYLATFIAAGGQTIGKMAAKIKVVPADPAAPASERVTFGHAIVRAAAYLVSTLPAGLGFLPAFIGPDHRALHDRLADTRVIKA